MLSDKGSIQISELAHKVKKDVNEEANSDDVVDCQNPLNIRRIKTREVGTGRSTIHDHNQHPAIPKGQKGALRVQ